MARKCKCVVCKKPLTNDTAYRVVEKGVNKYYCSEIEYNFYISEKKNRDKLVAFMRDDIMNYGVYGVLPPIALKKLKDINRTYTYEVILETCRTLKDTLSYWARREDKFDTEYDKVSYLCSIINNNIHDVYKKMNEEKRRLLEGDAPVKMIDLDIVNLDIPIKQTKGVDISKFLD